MVNEITFDKLPQAVGYLTEQVERIHKIVAALQPQTATDDKLMLKIAHDYMKLIGIENTQCIIARQN